MKKNSERIIKKFSATRRLFFICIYKTISAETEKSVVQISPASRQEPHHTVKKIIDFPVPNRDVSIQALPGRE
jgi:hypothetical protein